MISQREEFLEWWYGRHYDDADTEVKKAAWCAWQAARESEGGEAAAEIVNKPWPKGVVPVPKTGRWYAVHLLDNDGDIPHGTQLYTHPPKQQSGAPDFDYNHPQYCEIIERITEATHELLEAAGHPTAGGCSITD